MKKQIQEVFQQVFPNDMSEKERLENKKLEQEKLAVKLWEEKQTYAIQFIHSYVTNPSVLLACKSSGILRFVWCYVGPKTAAILKISDLPIFILLL